VEPLVFPKYQPANAGFVTEGARVIQPVWVRGAPRKEVMEKVVINAQPRDVIGKQVRALRRAGLLPAVIYGHHIAPIAISLNFHDTSMMLPRVSSSQLVDVDVNGKKHTVLVRERQRNPVSGDLLHVDFQAVSLTEKLRVNVGLQFKGEAPAVKMFDGIVVTSLETVEVECLPGDLPNHLEIDLSVLGQIGDAVYVRDIPLPPKVQVLDDLDEVVVIVTAPISEAALAAEEMAAAEPEVIEKGKKEEEEY
jgi:large subunit ribosomal protein L25